MFEEEKIFQKCILQGYLISFKKFLCKAISLEKRKVFMQGNLITKIIVFHARQSN